MTTIDSDDEVEDFDSLSAQVDGGVFKGKAQKGKNGFPTKKIDEADMDDALMLDGIDDEEDEEDLSDSDLSSEEDDDEKKGSDDEDDDDGDDEDSDEDEDENDEEEKEKDEKKESKKGKKGVALTAAELLKQKLRERRRRNPKGTESIAEEDEEDLKNSVASFVGSAHVPQVKKEPGGEGEDDDEELGASDAEAEAAASADVPDSEFFERAPVLPSKIDFEDMMLSRGMLRSIRAMGYAAPTPIQASAIGVILAGKDLCANAITGSGKTAAFLIPVIERLAKVRPPAHVAAASSARCVVLVPTRELALQCREVFDRLSEHTALTCAVVVGGAGAGMQQQVAQLTAGVDVAIATPGRLIDHVLNSPSVTLRATEILVLDEADQLLDMGFQPQIEELSRLCSCKERRQTLLFSATMTDAVDSLAKLSLHHPVWLAVNRKYDMANTLTHELVRISISELLPGGTRGSIAAAATASAAEKKVKKEENSSSSSSSSNESGAPGATATKDGGGEKTFATTRVTDLKLAALLALCKTQVRHRVLIFCRSKYLAHRARLILMLAGLHAEDMHRDVTPAQRVRSLNRFRDGDIDFLVCTDVASRGLDIENVQAVINFDLPKTLVRYVHRVGRTARAGHRGRAISLATEYDMDIVKQIIEHAHGRVVKKKLPDAMFQRYLAAIEECHSDVQEVIDAEINEAEIDESLRDVRKTENFVLHRDEILARPKKTWFMTPKEKRNLERAAAAAAAAAGGEPAAKRAATAADVVKGHMQEALKSRSERRAEAARDKKAARKADRKKDRNNREKLIAQRAKREKSHERAEAIISAKSAKRLAKRGELKPVKDKKGGKKTTRASSEGPGGAASSKKKGFPGLAPGMHLSRKAGKKSHNSFKSKARHKRR